MFRGKVAAVSPKIYPAYAFHGATAVLGARLIARSIERKASPKVPAAV